MYIDVIADICADPYPTGALDGTAGMDQMGFDYGQVLYPQF
jgi:hypothetical protein